MDAPPPIPQPRVKRDWPMYHDLGGMNEKVSTVRNFLANRSNILFYGPSGCGKTIFAEAIANESVEPFYELSGDNLQDALPTLPLVYWMNETIKVGRQVQVIGAVDNPCMMEDELIAKFNFSIHFDLPNEAARAEMVPFLFRQLRAEGSAITSGYSITQLKDFLRQFILR